MYNIMSYKQNDLVYDNNVYTITFIYYNKTFKIYISYFTQSTSLNDRSKYCIIQFKNYSIINDLETFRKETTTYRNARDQTKKQRDEVIK